MNNQKKLLNNFNYLKVTMMIFIIFYHSIALWSKNGWLQQFTVEENMILQLLAEWLNLIHIYVFTFVSGYIYSYIRFTCGHYNSFCNFVKRKFKRLIIPYIFVSIIWCIPFYVFYKNSNIEAIIYDFVLGYAPSQLWYLLMLFFVFVFIYYPSNQIKRMSVKNTFLLSLIIFILYIGLSLLIKLPFQILTSIKYIAFFILGMNFDEILKKFNIIPYWRTIFLINICFFCIYFFMPNSTILNKVIINIIAYFVSVSGIFALVGLFQHIDHLRIWKSSIYIHMKNNNFVMYLLHQQIIWAVISFFYDYVSTYFLILMCFIISLVLSYILSEILRKNCYIRFLLGEDNL